jgi:hypothetical protein
MLVGPGPVSADGTTPVPRAGRQNDTIISELHGRYYEQAYRGNMFMVATQAVATTTVGLATTYTGLVLSNPVGATVNLVLNKCSLMQSVIQATNPEAFALAYGFNASTNVTHTAALTPQPTRIGSGAVSQAKADTSATLPTAPLYGTFMGDAPTPTQNAAGGVVDLEGSVILLPGAYALWVTPGQASVAGMWFSFQWEETPV